MLSRAATDPVESAVWLAQVELVGLALQDDLERAADPGFDLHVAKPASLSRLDELLRSLPRTGAATRTETPSNVSERHSRGHG